VVESAGFGLPPEEFGSPKVIAANSVGNIRWIKEVQWNVTNLFLHESAEIASSKELLAADERGAGFAYLTDQASRQNLIAASPLWRKVKSHLQEIWEEYRHIPGMTGERLREQTELIILTIERKVQQALNSIGLSHSKYYTNQTIIEAIAKFIASGVSPIDSDASSGEDQ
jgi:hypothetical protein